MKQIVVTILLCTGALSLLVAQREGIRLNTPLAENGYLLFQNLDSTYLVNNCGQIVHFWNGGTYHNHPKLLPTGQLIGQEDTVIRILDWQSNIDLIKPFQENDLSHQLRLDYEIILLPNGNFLCLGRRFMTSQESIDLGFHSSAAAIRFDVVVEIDANSGAIVWEWRIIDHVIQERDSRAANFGSIKDNPQLLNIDAISNYDWQFEESFMINGMDYNAELDQIVLSVRKISEIIIIDHSTTTEEAAGHSGGKYDKGGDILYRWGNPQNYGQGNERDQELYYQHDPNWIKYGEHKGKIIVFNNGLNRPDVQTIQDQFSSVDIIEPMVDTQGNYPVSSQNRYYPEEPSWRYVDTSGTVNFYSGYTSGASILPNGNVIITQGRNSRVFEVTPDKQLAWEYAVPRSPYIFRVEKYSADFQAFHGAKLIPQGTVEDPPSTYPCSLFTSVQEESDELGVNVKVDNGVINIVNRSGRRLDVDLYSLDGRSIAKKRVGLNELSIDVTHAPQGIYLVALSNGSIRKVEKVFLR